MEFEKRNRVRLAGPTTQSVIQDTALLQPVQLTAYQRRGTYWCCICRPGETDIGGLATDRVEGSTIGIALRDLCAIGWCSFMFCCCWKVEALYVLGTEERRSEGVGWTCCWSGEPSGEPEDSEPRSDEDGECMEWSCDGELAIALERIDFWHTSSSVRRSKGQNISSSSNSKLFAASSTRR